MRFLTSGLALSELLAHGRGVRPLTRLVSKLFRPGNMCTVVLDSEINFIVHLDDPYWVRLLSASYEYEPEIDHVLAALHEAAHDVQFIDAGANQGYWALRGALRFPTIAIEASPEMIARLEANLSINSLPHRVDVIAAAVAASSEDVTFYGDIREHAGGSMFSDLAPEHLRTSTPRFVPAVRLSSIVNQGAVWCIKLDVEGAELQIIRELGSNLGSSDHVLIYEDHGRDRSHTLTRSLLDLNMVVLGWIQSQFRPIQLAQVELVKADVRRGYNFVAVARSSGNLQVLLAYRPGKNRTGHTAVV